MQKNMKSGVIVALVLTGMLTACGGGSTTPSGGNTGGNTGGSTGNTTLRARFAACPIASMSSDPAASTCLAGTYTLSTLDGKACTLTVRADGSYDFASPTLTYTFTPKPSGFRLYNHANPAGDTHQVLWKVSDPITTDADYDLTLEARFGPGLSASDQYLEVQTERVAANQTRTNVTCKTSL